MIPAAPVLSAGDVVVYCGDALEVLPDLPTASVACCITDPPYGEGNARWDGPRSQEWYTAWLRDVNRIVVANGPIVTFAPRRKLDFVMAALREVRGDSALCPLQLVVWVHRQGFRVAEGYLRPEHEMVVISGRLLCESDEVRGLRHYPATARPIRRRQPTANGFGPHLYVPHPSGPMAGTVIEAPRTKPSEATGHPTQKPAGLMRYLVALAGPAGGVVLDPFAGSGTTLVATRAMGRRGIGIERSPETCDLIVGRCAQEALPWASSPRG